MRHGGRLRSAAIVRGSTACPPHFGFASVGAHSTGKAAAKDGEQSGQQQPQRLTGRVLRWHPFDRKGTVVESVTGREYTIANARAFETVLPTLLYGLDGAKVEFTPDDSPDADRVIIRARTEEMTEHFYQRQPPVNYLNPLAAEQRATAPSGGGGERVSERESTRPAEEDGPTHRTLFAKNILVDLSSIASDKLIRSRHPLASEEAVRPTANLKDMRSSRIFDKQTNEYLKLRKALGSTEAAEAEMQRRATEEARSVVRREVVATGVGGVVVAWSAIHRSGVVLEGAAEVESDAVVDCGSLKNASIIRNVFSFQSALPTSQHLLHRRVVFTKTKYSTTGERTFAEEIVVEGDLVHDASASSPEEARERKQHEKLLEKRERQLGVLTARELEKKQAARVAKDAAPTSVVVGDWEEAAAAEIPEGPVFGVVTRWSGGQGTVESGDGNVYYVRSAADFEQLVEKDSHAVRGAVVTFTVDREHPRYAREIHILSTAATSVVEMKPLLDRVPGSSTRRSEGPTGRGPAAAVAVVETNDLTGRKVLRSAEVEPEDAEWVEGTLISWSPNEDQGIISGSDGVRYVLRDAEENVIQHSKRKPLLKKGRRVKFTAFGSTGRLACNVVPLDTEADEAELAESELRPKEPRFSMDGNLDEAIASPMSTSYWISRMAKSGYDVSEVKALQNRAITPDEFDDDSDDPNAKKLLDSEDVLKKDEWWNDPRKNRRFPNSDMTAGHLALMGPASVLNTALKASNPKTLNKMLNKYQSRLTEEMKEVAWQKAKEMAPMYDEQVKKARERNEEPTFYYF